MKPIRRILLKLSGEMLSKGHDCIDVAAISDMLSDIKEAYTRGIEIGIVIGGGNILRGGRCGFDQRIKRATADTMGMIATMINALALRDLLNDISVPAEILSARGVDGVLTSTSAHLATQYLASGKVVIFCAGTGNPFVTTDSTASLRAIEIEADAIFKATTVDGIYDKDPKQYDDAKRFSLLNYEEVLKKELGVMDLTAFIQCRDFNMPICVFSMEKPGALLRILDGEAEGTWVGR
ncbi:MAG: UMP kinase [Francisellaceae bacterium]